MQGIKQIKVQTERINKKTFCRIDAKINYIRFQLSPTEQKVFIKNLGSYYTGNSEVTVFTNITLFHGDVDNQSIANQLVTNKALTTLNKVVKNALSKIIEMRKRELQKLYNINQHLSQTIYNEINYKLLIENEKVLHTR